MTIKTITLQNNNNYNEQEPSPAREKCVWAVDNIYPHIITKHTCAHNSESKKFYDNIEDAFHARRVQCKFYAEAWETRTEFSNTHDLNYS